MTWGEDAKMIRCKEAIKTRFDKLHWYLQAEAGKKLTQNEVLIKLLDTYEVVANAENTD